MPERDDKYPEQSGVSGIHSAVAERAAGGTGGNLSSDAFASSVKRSPATGAKSLCASRAVLRVTAACQALVIPALSLSMTWPIVKLAGVCEGGNSTNDWAICATNAWAGIKAQA